MRYEVIVIGAGLGGLECACLLSQAGHSVLVLEKEHHVGGCLQSYRRRGLDYDTGFHYVGGLGEGQSLHEAFARLQLLDLPWHRLDEAYDRITIGDRTFSLVQGFDAFAGALAAEFPAEREALREYAGLLARVARDGGGEVRPADGNELLETGAWDYLSTRFRDPLLRDVLSGNALRMELRRESLPLFTFAHCNAGYVESSWRLPRKTAGWWPPAAGMARSTKRTPLSATSIPPRPAACCARAACYASPTAAGWTRSPIRWGC